ncbi:CopG family ribbon-helix-helix protein [Inquilinus sp. CA228]|uniref:CopG family ribbon-helix-helix protein n=1 Tax=Inquilinus sp. CA228 TaxID=3455609 RepID=UPI003F8D0FDC
MSVVTVCLDDDTANALDRLAERLDRSPDDVAAQAIREYVVLQARQRAEIEAGLAQADAGDFASDTDVARVLAKFGRPAE